jgi:hypothetical protein
MLSRINDLMAAIRRRVEFLLTGLALAFMAASWVLNLFGSNTLVVNTVVAAIGIASAGLGASLSAAAADVRTDLRERFPARVCDLRQDMADDLGRARQLIQIISYEELSGADRSRMRFYDMLRRAAQEIPHQRIIWNLDHVNWIRQDLSLDPWTGRVDYDQKRRLKCDESAL